VHFERVTVEACGAAQLFDRQIDLIGDEEVEPEDVMRRLARAAAVEPLAVPQLVALPRLADREAGQQRQQGGEERGIAVHARSAPDASGVNDRTIASQRPWARSTSSSRSRAAPAPPGERATQCTRSRTSATASAGAAARPTRDSTAMSTMSSPM